MARLNGPVEIHSEGYGLPPFFIEREIPERDGFGRESSEFCQNFQNILLNFLKSLWFYLHEELKSEKGWSETDPN